jgi:hypothetical protein
MRTGISITVTRSDRLRLEALVRDRNALQKQVWRAEIVLLSADGVGTNESKRRTGKSKTCVALGQFYRRKFRIVPPRFFKLLILLRNLTRRAIFYI